MSNFISETTLEEYFENTDLLLSNKDIRRDFINKFISNITTESGFKNPNKIINNISFLKCGKILDMSTQFYDDVLIKSGRSKYKKFSSLPIPNQKYYQDIKHTLFLIFIQYILDIPLNTFNYNNMISFAQKIKDVWIQTNFFILKLLLDLSFIYYEIESSRVNASYLSDLNEKLFHFYKNLRSNLGIIDVLTNIQNNTYPYVSSQFIANPYILGANENIYNKPILTRPEIREDYIRSVSKAKKRNNTLSGIIRTTTNILPMPVRPTIHNRALSQLYRMFINNTNPRQLNISNILYPNFSKRYIRNVIQANAVNAGGPSRNFYNDLSIHFTHSIKLKKIYNLNNNGIPKKKSNKNNSNYIKEIAYVPYIEHFYSDQGNSIYKPQNKSNGSPVKLTSNIQIILNIIFFIIICAGSLKNNNVNNFTINDCYLSYIFRCYLIESIVDLYNIPPLEKNIAKYQLYLILTSSDKKEEFDAFKGTMISLYCAINNLEGHPYYLSTLDETINENKKIFNHFINKNMKYNDLINILFTYYYNISNYSSIRPDLQKIFKLNALHSFMKNHVISKSITSSIEDKDALIKNLDVHLSSSLNTNQNTSIQLPRKEKIKDIIETFINSLNDEEIKTFVICLTGSSVMPERIRFDFFNNNDINDIDRMLSIHTCSKSMDIRYNFKGKRNSVRRVEGYNGIESVVYDNFITKKNDIINIMRSTLSGGGFQMA